MERSEKINLPFSIHVNGNEIKQIVIGRHYLESHAHYMNDGLILQLVQSLDGRSFNPDSIGQGIEYYAVDIQLKGELNKVRIYRLFWLFEGDFLEVIGVVNAYRVRKKKKP